MEAVTAIKPINDDDQRFIPPYPFRPETSYSVGKSIAIFRTNIIGVFSAGNFSERLLYRRHLRLHTFVCNDPDLVRSAFTTQHAAFHRKSPQMRFALRPLLGDGLFVSDGPVWELRRGIVGPIIHASRIGDFAPTMMETVEEWRQHWLMRGDDARIDVLSEMAQLTAEIISRSVFGRRLGREYTSVIVDGFTDYQKRIDQLDLASLLGLPDWFPRFRTMAVRRSLRRVHGVIDDIIDRFETQLRKGVADQQAVIGRLFAAKEADGRPLSRDAIRNESIVIFMAGHETTANTLAWAWYLISQAPWVRSKLSAELDTVLAGRAPELADVAKLAYTRAIIDETLRLYPPVPLLARQSVADGVIGGQHVPKGSIVIVAPWLLHRRPDLWSMPDHFMPERFDPRVAPRPDKHAYVPFSVGPRTCPGRTFGLTEAVLCLATLAQQFDLALEPGHEVVPTCRLTLRPGEALPMRLKRRTPGANSVAPR